MYARTFLTLLTTAAISTLACSSDPSRESDTGTHQGHPDGGPNPDTGTNATPDTGTNMTPDTGTNMTPDSGTMEPDSGMPPADGGSPLGPGDPIGTVLSAQTTNCGGALPGSCTRLNVHCDGVADQGVIIKVSAPTGTSRGTILFTTGGPGTALYEMFASNASMILEMARSSGFTAVQVAFTGGLGWLSGPGGPRKEACRYATSALWVYEHVHQSSTALPFCATGNSGGGTVIAYALSHYGMHTLFDMVEPTSAPVMARIDYSCDCDQGNITTPCTGSQPYCYSGNAQFLDGAYGDNRCSQAGANHDHQWDASFLADSVNAPDATLAFPSTSVRVLLGDMDVASPVSNATFWQNSITSTAKSIECAPNSGHTIPESASGAMKIASDLTAHCALQ